MLRNALNWLHLLARYKDVHGKKPPTPPFKKNVQTCYILRTYVQPRNKPEDPAGYPVNHNGFWEPWVTLTPEELEVERMRKTKF